MSLVYESLPILKTAEEDIEVVKSLKCKEDNQLLSPYTSFVLDEFGLSLEDVSWKINETKESNIEILEIKGFTENTYYRTAKGLYSFKTQKDANIIGITCKKFKAVIPKGSQYYEGTYGFCSNKLKILEELK